MTALVAAIAVPAYGDEVARMAAKFTKKDGKKVVKVLPANSITGKHVKELTLGKVPNSLRADRAATAVRADVATNADNAANAANAANADKVDGKDASEFASQQLVQRISVKLSFGQERPLIAHGPLSLHAQCIANGPGGDPRIRVYAKTTEANSFLDGPSGNLAGGQNASDFLQPTTAAANAEIWGLSQTMAAGMPLVRNDADEGFVAAPSGAVIGGDGDSVVLALHAFGADCSVLARVALDTVG